MNGASSLILSIATLVSALAALLVGFYNRKQIQNVHIDINSRMDQLLRAHGAEMKAEGVAERCERLAVVQHLLRLEAHLLRLLLLRRKVGLQRLPLLEATGERGKAGEVHQIASGSEVEIGLLTLPDGALPKRLNRLPNGLLDDPAEPVRACSACPPSCPRIWFWENCCACPV